MEMFKWSPFPLLRYAIYFMIGILGYGALDHSIWSSVWWLLPILLVLYVLSAFILKKRFLTGLMGLFTVVCLGGTAAFFNDHTNWEDHISRLEGDRIQAFSGQLVSDVYEKEKYYRFTLKVDSVLVQDATIKVSGLIHLYIQNPGKNRHKYGDYLYVKKPFSGIRPPGNPNEFNYQKYISRSNIYGQCFVGPEKIMVVYSDPPNPVMNFAFVVRSKILDQLKSNIAGEREQQIAFALILGVKSFLENDVKMAYSSAGAMHVLAVSGLHVGIIYLILVYLLKFLKRPKGGNVLFGLLIIGGIWLYAMVTGLSPSVMRAATMFTVIAFRDISNRRPNIYNSLGLAALILLTFNPYFIYAVGFQLSFIAVFGIVYFYPKLYGLVTLRSWLPDKIWSITCISIAAQISTFPLTTFYFHQFPVYFLLSNLFVIPGTALILMIAIPTILLGSLFEILGTHMGWLLSKVLFIVNEVVFHIEALPNSLVTWLYLDLTEVILIYGIIILVFSAFQYRSFLALSSGLTALALLGVSISIRDYERINQKKLVIYEIRHHTAFDLINASAARFFINGYDENELDLLKFKVDPFRLAHGLESIESSIFNWKNDPAFQTFGPITYFMVDKYKVAILHDNPGAYNWKNPLYFDFFVISNDAISSLHELPGNLQFGKLIISSDNGFFNSRKLKNEAISQGLSVHTLAEEGFWMLDLSKIRS